MAANFAAKIGAAQKCPLAVPALCASATSSSNHVFRVERAAASSHDTVRGGILPEAPSGELDVNVARTGCGTRFFCRFLS